MTRPSFVVFYLDDLGFGDLGCYGSPDFRTPHIDALAGDGVLFTNWYSCSPVCSPSRASLLTGRYPQRTGVDRILSGRRGTEGLPPSELTLATALRRLGYRTAMFGKWHLGLARQSRPNAHGFDEFFGFLSGCVDYYSHLFYYELRQGLNPVHDLWHNDREVWRNGQYMTDMITDKAVQWLERFGQDDEPLFLYLPYNAPHYPMHAPKEYVDRYNGLSPDRRIVGAMISAVDDGVGRIVQTLKELGRYEDTVVFFSSDNGPSSESRNWLDGSSDVFRGGSAGVLKGHKASLFEGGIREPAILTLPRQLRRGQVCEETAAMFDIFPTFLELAGGTVPEDRVIDGSSLLPVLMNGAPSPHRQLFWEYNGQLACRQDRWKLVLNGMLDFSRKQPDEVHMSDLQTDRGEQVNLAPEHSELVRQMSQDANNWLAEVSGRG